MTDKRFHEILICRNSTPVVLAESLRDAQGLPVQRLSSSDIVPPRALTIAQEAGSIIARTCGIRRDHLRASVQTTQAPSSHQGKVYGGSVLLLDEDATLAQPAALELAISYAAQYAALLANKPAQRNPPSQVFAAVNAAIGDPPTLTLDDLAGSVLLGAKLKLALDIIVPGFRTIQLFERIRRARPSALRTEVREIEGRLRGTMVGGRGHRLFVRGFDMATNKPFGDHAVCFSEQWRGAVASALAVQGQRVALSIAEERFGDGTAKPRVKRVLMRLVPLQPRSPDVEQGDIQEPVSHQAA